MRVAFGRTDTEGVTVKAKQVIVTAVIAAVVVVAFNHLQSGGGVPKFSN